MSAPLEIASPANARFKTWQKLLHGRGIKKHGQALVSGRSFIHEILLEHADRVQAVISCPGEAREVLEALPVPPEYPVFQLSPELFAELDIYGIKAPILQISALPAPRWEEVLPPGLTVFVPFQNPINLGTTIRSAAAFDANVVLLQEAATPYLPKSLRASGPAVFKAPLFQGPGLRELAGLDLPIYALSPKGQSIYDFDFKGGTGGLEAGLGLVAGLEGPGLDEYWPPEKRLTIPMEPGVESLNASVSMSIAMAFYRAAVR